MASPLLHLQLGGEVVPQDASLGVVEVPDEGLVALLPVGEEEELGGAGGLPVEGRGRPPSLYFCSPDIRRDWGEIFLKYPSRERKRWTGATGRSSSAGAVSTSWSTGRISVCRGVPYFFFTPSSWRMISLADSGGFGDEVGEVGDVLLQLLGLGGAFEDVLLVDVPQADVRHVLGLDPVQAKARHEVGHHHGVLLGLPDDGDGLVDVRRMTPRPWRRWSFSCFCWRVNWAPRRTQSDRQAVHRSRISPTPMTLGIPSTRTLKLQAKESWRGWPGRASA